MHDIWHRVDLRSFFPVESVSCHLLKLVVLKQHGAELWVHWSSLGLMLPVRMTKPCSHPYYTNLPFSKVVSSCTISFQWPCCEPKNLTNQNDSFFLCIEGFSSRKDFFCIQHLGILIQKTAASLEKKICISSTVKLNSYYKSCRSMPLDF